MSHTKFRDGQGAVSDQGAQVMISYLQGTGRLFSIGQVAKFRQGVLLGHGERGKVAVPLSQLYHPC